MFGKATQMTDSRLPNLVAKADEPARAVMEHTPHVMLAGQGAIDFAREQGLEAVEVTPEAPAVAVSASVGRAAARAARIAASACALSRYCSTPWHTTRSAGRGGAHTEMSRCSWP